MNRYERHLHEQNPQESIPSLVYDLRMNYQYFVDKLSLLKIKSEVRVADVARRDYLNQTRSFSYGNGIYQDLYNSNYDDLPF